MMPIIIEEFNNSSLADSFRQVLKRYVPFHGDDLFVAGGFFARQAHGLPPSDIDVYVKKEHIDACIKEYKSAHYEFFYPQILDHKVTWHKAAKNPFGYHLRAIAPDGQVVELLSFHKPNDENFLARFDFHHVALGLTENRFFGGKESLRCVFQKELIYNQDLFEDDGRMGVIGNNRLDRMLKYTQLGFTITPEETWNINRSLLLSKHEIWKSTY